MRISTAAVKAKNKKHNKNNKILFNSPGQPWSLAVNSSAFPCLWKMVLFVNLIATNVPLKLAFLPQVISCI
jgi:hypothetical protein